MSAIDSADIPQVNPWNGANASILAGSGEAMGGRVSAHGEILERDDQVYTPEGHSRADRQHLLRFVYRASVRVGRHSFLLAIVEVMGTRRRRHPGNAATVAPSDCIAPRASPYRWICLRADTREPVPGLLAVVPVVGTLLVIGASSRALTWRPFAGFGPYQLPALSLALAAAVVRGNLQYRVGHRDCGGHPGKRAAGLADCPIH
jgi:hypothetical protein